MIQSLATMMKITPEHLTSPLSPAMSHEMMMTAARIADRLSLFLMTATDVINTSHPLVITHFNSRVAISTAGAAINMADDGCQRVIASSQLSNKD